MNDDTSKVQIDADWKAEARAEKERLAAQERTRSNATKGGARASGELPKADLRSLVEFIGSRAMLSLGLLQDPVSREIIIDLDGAKFAIDLLGVIEQKTKGNLTAEEADELKQISAGLRAQFVHVTNLVSKSAAAGSARGASPPPK